MSHAALRVAALLAVTAAGLTACDGGSPTQPEPRPVAPREVSGRISFATAGPDGAPVVSHSEAGFVVQFGSANWRVATGFGSPRPYCFFQSPTGASVSGEVRITAGGNAFVLKSVDLYSSITPIPYVIVGTLAGVKSLELGGTLPASGVVGNTFGEFRTVTNPAAGQLVDSLTLTLTNPAMPVGGNPVGLDNIVLER